MCFPTDTDFVDTRTEFMSLYHGLLRGLNLVQQKTWRESQLAHYFPELRPSWEPLLAARHPAHQVSKEKRLALERLFQLLETWPEAIEAGLLKRRLQKIAGYFAEVDKEHCDAESLNFFLQDFPLLEVVAGAANTLSLASSPRLSAMEARDWMNLELKKLFPEHDLHTILSTGTLARASTTKRGIRLREDATFTREELEMLTVHEAWVHLGTNLAGILQKDLPWLAGWHPGITGFQEGLALIAEIITGHWFERRELQVLLRHEAGLLALRGHNARDVWTYLCDHGLEAVGALEMTLRVFRGCSLDGGMAFGKEFQYLLGLHQWLVRQDVLSSEDMLIAMSGKMDFLEWEVLRSTRLKEKVILPTPPEQMVSWMKSAELKKLHGRLSFKKVA